MGDLDFTNQAGFSWYCVLLLVSGVILLAFTLLPGLGRSGRVVNLLFGLGFLGYGGYLVFFFQGGSYFVFFKAFIVPIVLVVNSIRGVSGANMRRRGAAHPPVAGQAPYPYQAAPMQQTPQPAQPAEPFADPVQSVAPSGE